MKKAFWRRPVYPPRNMYRLSDASPLIVERRPDGGVSVIDPKVRGGASLIPGRRWSATGFLGVAWHQIGDKEARRLDLIAQRKLARSPERSR